MRKDDPFDEIVHLRPIDSDEHDSSLKINEGILPQVAHLLLGNSPNATVSC